MKLEEVEPLVRQLDPSDQLKLATGIWESLRGVGDGTATQQSRRDAMMASLDYCDTVARSIEGEFDSASDLHEIRKQRMADIDAPMS